jgi:hypothetical protein
VVAAGSLCGESRRVAGIPQGGIAIGGLGVRTDVSGRMAVAFTPWGHVWPKPDRGSGVRGTVRSLGGLRLLRLVSGLLLPALGAAVPHAREPVIGTPQRVLEGRDKNGGAADLLLFGQSVGGFDEVRWQAKQDGDALGRWRELVSGRRVVGLGGHGVLHSLVDMAPRVGVLTGLVAH